MKRRPGEVSLEARLKAATQAQAEGLSCPEAVLACYRDELGSSTAENRFRQAQDPQMCDVFAAALTVLRHLLDGAGAEEEWRAAAARLGREYGSCRCGELLYGEENPQCRMRVKDSILLIEQARKKTGQKN